MEKKYMAKRKNLITAALAVFIVVLVILFIRVITEEKVIQEYSDGYVAMAELPSQLDFTYFEEEEWKDKLKEINAGRNLNGKLTYGKLKKLLEQLSVQEYVTYNGKLPWKNVPPRVECSV